MSEQIKEVKEEAMEQQPTTEGQQQEQKPEQPKNAPKCVNGRMQGLTKPKRSVRQIIEAPFKEAWIWVKQHPVKALVGAATIGLTAYGGVKLYDAAHAKGEEDGYQRALLEANQKKLEAANTVDDPEMNELVQMENESMETVETEETL